MSRLKRGAADPLGLLEGWKDNIFYDVEGRKLYKDDIVYTYNHQTKSLIKCKYVYDWYVKDLSTGKDYKRKPSTEIVIVKPRDEDAYRKKLETSKFGITRCKKGPYDPNDRSRARYYRNLTLEERNALIKEYEDHDVYQVYWWFDSKSN